jgi:hypothetical protein
MSRTTKHPPKPDRFTKKHRTGKHARDEKLRRVTVGLTPDGRRVTVGGDDL